MSRIIAESTSVSPDALGAQLWHAVARMVCRQVNPVDDHPCDACRRYVYPLVKPFARALLIAGKRDTNNYVLAGRAVEWFLDSAAEHYGVVDGLGCPSDGRADATARYPSFDVEVPQEVEIAEESDCFGGADTP